MESSKIWESRQLVGMLEYWFTFDGIGCRERFITEKVDKKFDIKFVGVNFCPMTYYTDTENVVGTFAKPQIGEFVFTMFLLIISTSVRQLQV